LALTEENCRALLEVIATKLATSTETVHDYVKKTLLYHTTNQAELDELVKTTLDSLLEQELIDMDNLSTFSSTLLGQAIVASAFSPSDGIFIHNELQKAIQAFVMDSDVHFLYTFTPVHSLDFEVNWQKFRMFISNYSHYSSF
jgi:replicative superfamily II helicase